MNNKLRLNLPKLYAITDSKLSGLSHAAQVSALCAGGAKLIQLREKTLSQDQFYSDAREAVKIARRYGATILVNDRVDLALAVEADGVHLGQEDLPVEAARRLLGETAIIGFSTHNLEQAQLAKRLAVDYLAIGPIFKTTTKRNTEPVVRLEGVRQLRNSLPKTKLVAIGGINGNNSASVLNAGADSVAVVSFLVENPRFIEHRTRELLTILQF